MNLNEVVETSFRDSFELKKKVVGDLSPIIVAASKLLAESIKNGGKILSCGNGGSSCDADHFMGEIVGRFQIERDGLPAISLVSSVATLTAIANDYGYEEVFSRQIKALGKNDDVLLAISTSGNSENIIRAINMAHEVGMRVVALTGKDGGKLTGILNSSDIEIRAASRVTPRIQELHILIIHCLCDLIDRILFENRFGERA